MQIYWDDIHKMAYATDASAYREIPMGVAYPETEDDLRALLQLARERHTHLIPRAGGTSIAGQVVGSGIVVDVSRYMNRILWIDPEKRLVRVQPGVVRDELNKALEETGLFFSPETSTSNRCCIGGMVGNNSCGMHSLLYGSTRHHVVGLRLLLTDGTAVEVRGDGSYRVEGESALWHSIEQLWTKWRRGGEADRRKGGEVNYRQLLEEAFPDKELKRRSCGYALDEGLESLTALIVGSEGTLALVTEIEVSLDPIPSKHKLLVAAHLRDLNDSWQMNLIALKHGPSAVELMDGKILELCKDNKQAQRDRFFVQGEPGALVIAEFTGEDAEAKADAFVKEASIPAFPLKGKEARGSAYAFTRIKGEDIQRVWNLRKAGLGVLNGMQGDAKPVGVIEDTAVAPERMEAYMHDFMAMMDEIGLSCVYYGHIATGELHLRPILNLKDAHDRKLFREVAEKTAAIVKKHKGSLSGEHGDGRLRGEFIPLMYGEEVYQMMVELKRTWDPEGLLNIGKIVETPAMDVGLRAERLRGGKAEGLVYRWEKETLLQKIERCNGAGDCRKSQVMGGAICPAYKATGDELMTTRARANVLREVLTHNKDAWRNEDIKRQMDSCLACKSCLRECSSSVDMTRIRSEVLQQRYKKTGVPLRTWLVAHMAMIENMGALVRPIYNFCASNRVISSIIKWVVGFDQRREIPLLKAAGGDTEQPIEGGLFFTQRSATSADESYTPSNVETTLAVQEGREAERRVVMYVDEFTKYHEPELAETMKKMLEALGYGVLVPKIGESGRAAMSKGCLHYARKLAIKNVKQLKDIISDDVPLVGIEPSCILSFRDEYPDLMPDELREAAKALGKNSLLYDEFIVREVEAGRIPKSVFKAIDADLWVHHHCHQKALVGIEKTVTMLTYIPKMTVHVVPSGCCGMAGSFGYEKRHYEMSMAIGELVLFPTIRRLKGGEAERLKGGRAERRVMVAAPGTSCRQQIWDGTGIRAVHPIMVLAESVLGKLR